MRQLNFVSHVVLICALGWIFPLYAAESDVLTRIGAQIEQYPIVRAEFIQTKQMAAMKRPLITSGRLVYSRRHGVLWQIEQPYRIGYVLGEEKIVEIGADGIRKERGLREVPGLAQVGRIFRAMLGANAAALRESFNVAVQGDAGKWEIELKPRQSQLAQFLTGLQLSGGHFVETIRIGEAGGDTAHIRFYNTQGAFALSEPELLLFSGEPGKP